MIGLTIIFQNENRKLVEVENNGTILDLKEACLLNFEEIKNLEKNEIYFIFGGRQLKDEEKICEIRNLESGASLHLRINSENQRPNIEEHESVFNEVADKINNAKLFHENLQIRVKGAQRNLEPRQLERRDVSDTAHRHEETIRVRHFGEFLGEVANTLLIWSNSLNELGEKLKEDELLGADRSAPEYVQTRRLIQNNMDACRYAAPTFNSIATFVIPLAQNPGVHGRTLAVVRPR